MSLDPLIRHARILWRADAILAEIRLHQLLTRFGLTALAALVALFGLLMLELAAYFALVQQLSAVLAALILGAVNFAVAGLLVLIGARRKPSREYDLALEVHNAALEALGAEAGALRAEVQALVNTLKHPMDGALLGLIAPLATSLLRTLRKPATRD
jgi:hypothetical protein